MLLLWFIALFSVTTALPMVNTIVDMTHVFDETTLQHPFHHKFEKNISAYEFPSFWTQVENYTSGSHAGTHMDAPRHFAPDGIGIDEISPYKLIAPAAVIDITQKAASDPDTEATVDDLLHWERLTGQTLNGTIVMIRTGWGQKWSDPPAYYGRGADGKLHYPGLSADAARWLVRHRAINGVGIDTLAFDRGITVDFPCHQILLPSGLFGLENVANMDKIPISGAQLFVLPMKMGKASGAPVRILASFPGVISQ